MDYRERNKWFITASKLKLFLDSPLLYKAIYVDEVDTSMIKDVAALELWDMVDKYVLTPEIFKQEYVFPVWGLKADLVAYCEKRGIELTGKEKVEDLKAAIYWDKKVLTQAQEDTVLGIASELSSQPLFEWWWDYYEAQKELTADYGRLKLKWTLDRFHYDEEKKEAIIRDLKTTSQMYYNAYNDNTQFFLDLSTRDPFHYKLQMAMYVWLVKQNYPEVENIKVIIDAVWTTDPYFYQWIVFDTKELELIWKTQIVQLLANLDWLEAGLIPQPELNRNKLCGNRYYKLGTEDCIQYTFDYLWPKIVDNIPKPDEMPDDFDRDSL